MLRINSTTTRAVTAFDVVGLFCIFGMPPYGFMPQLRRAHYNALHVYCQDNAIFFSAKKQTKKTAAQAFTGAAIYPKMQGNHPLYPHSTHYPHFVKHFLPHFRTTPPNCSIPGMSTWPEPPAIWQKNGGKSCRINHPRGAGKRHNFIKCPITPHTISCTVTASLYRRSGTRTPRRIP